MEITKNLHLFTCNENFFTDSRTGIVKKLIILPVATRGNNGSGGRLKTSVIFIFKMPKKYND